MTSTHTTQTTPTTASRRQALRYGCAASASLFGLAVAWPTLAQPAINQLRILCSGPAGSIPDIVARRAAEQLTRQFPQGAIVDNRPGAAGQIAVNALKASAPDGATILLAQGAVATVYPYLYGKLAYDPVVDLQPLSMAGEMTLALAVGPAVPGSVTNIEELIDWMRSNPKLANVASPGTGTLPHLLEVMLFREANVPWQHVVYAGGPPALVDLLGGQIAALVLPEGLFRQHKATGKLRVLPRPARSAARISLMCLPLSSNAFAVWLCANGLRFSRPRAFSPPQSMRCRSRCSRPSPALNWQRRLPTQACWPCPARLQRWPVALRKSSATGNLSFWPPV